MKIPVDYRLLHVGEQTQPKDKAIFKTANEDLMDRLSFWIDVPDERVGCVVRADSELCFIRKKNV